MGSVRCKALGTCRAHWDELPISRDTASGQRLLSVLAAGFREEAARLALEDELIANALVVLVGAHIAARASLSSTPAARGALRPMARSLGAAGDDLLLEKAVNSNLPHAIERGVERGVFASAKEATTALRALTEQITTSRTFPAGTLVDTVRTGRFLVPIGNNGLAVYQLASNGTAKLKTVLIAR